MDSVLLNIIFYGFLSLVVFFITYGLVGYAKQVFRANRR